MAQKVQVVLIDDIDGGDAQETLTFALDGVSYEIDLSSANASRLRAAFGPYVEHARKAGRTGVRRQRSSNRTGKSAQIRAWAREHGIQVNERGRIPADVTAKFEASQ